MYQNHKFFCDICEEEIKNGINNIYLFVNRETKEDLDICEKCLDFALMALSNFKQNLIEDARNFKLYYAEKFEILYKNTN